MESNKNHKILKISNLRASVKLIKIILILIKAYSKFRQKGSTLRDKNKKIKGLELTETLNNYAQTGSEYTKILNQIIKQNRLTDFEPVKLVSSVKRLNYPLNLFFTYHKLDPSHLHKPLRSFKEQLILPLSPTNFSEILIRSVLVFSNLILDCLHLSPSFE